jgi:O-antigen/teichoic acid export membrane protein
MFAAGLVEQTINFAVFVVLARVLGAEVFGLAMMAIVFILFAEYIVMQTVSEGLIQIRELDQGHLDAVFWSVLAVGFFLMACIAIFANLIASFYSQPEVADLLYGASPMIFLVAICAVPVTLLRRKLQFEALAIRAVAGAIGGGIVGIVLALNDFGVWSIIAQRLMLLLINAVLAWTAHPWRPGFRTTRIQFDQIVRFGVSMLGLRISELLSVQTPTLALGYFFGPGAVGYFTTAWRIVEIARALIVTSFCTVAHPVFARLRSDLPRASSLLKDILSASTLVTVPSFAGLALVAGPLVHSVFGDDWMPSVQIIQILCFVGMFFSVERVQQAFLLAMGNARSLFLLSFGEFLLGAILIVIFGQASAIMIVTIFVTRYYVLWPLRFAVIHSVTGTHWRWYVRTFFPLGLACAFMAASVYFAQRAFLDLGSSSRLVMSILIGVFTYLITIFLFFRARVGNAKRLLRSELVDSGAD